MREVLDGLARMQVGGGQHQRRDVEAAGVALEHAVGQQEQAVARLEPQLVVAPVRVRGGAERLVRDELDLLGPSVAQPERPRVPGVEHAGRLLDQVDADELAGHEPAVACVVAQRLVRAARLLEQAGSAPARVPQRAHDERRQQRRVDGMPHGVGHRDVQRVAVEREVERVAAHLPGRLEPARERELVGLAGERGGQQPPLDLGGQRQRHGALAPLEEIGVAAVGDHHVRQLVRRELDVLERGRVRFERQDQLEHADRVAAAGDRRDDARVLALADQDGPLTGERLAVGRPVQGHLDRRLLRARSRLARRDDVAETVQRTAAEVRDQEAHVAGVEHLAQRRGHRVHDAHGGGGLRARQQRAEVQPAGLAHARSLRRGA